MRKQLLIFFSVALGLAACKGDRDGQCEIIPETTNRVTIDWQSLEDSLPTITTKHELVVFFSRHPVMRDIFFNRLAYPSDSAFIDTLYNRFTHPSIDSLLKDTNRIFGDGSGLRNQFEEAFTNFRYYYPDFRVPRIETVITGLESDLYVSDSLVIVGLDHFLGRGARFEPFMYDYMKRRYHRDFIVPSVILLYGIDSRYNKIKESDKTVLADMVAYGKAYFFSKRMVPCTPDSVLIGYTTREITGANENESLIWSRFIEDQILFSTKAHDKQKYIGERPKTLEVGEECPGRIGTWVGWQILNEYQDSHPDMTLPEIMEKDDAQEIFRESGYKPQIVKLPERKKI